MTKIIFSNTMSKVGNKCVIYLIDNCEVLSSQGDGGFSVVEYLHIGDKKKIIVDMVVDFYMMTCGSSDFEEITCDKYKIQTNHHSIKKVISQLRKVIKNDDVDGINHIVPILKDILKDVKKMNITDIYVKEPNDAIKTFKDIISEEDIDPIFEESIKVID